MTNIPRLIQLIVNDHYAQTGIATIHGEQVMELALEILEDPSDNDVALIELLTQGVLRAGPIATEEE